MTITLGADLELALKRVAEQQGVSPEELALKTLREQMLPKTPVIEPRDDWERRLLSIGIDCGVSLSDEDLSREAMYD